jgi:F-type H+-transporting ATPase subunit gamma
VARPRLIRKRIGSIKNINKITRTMERVAQSRAMKLSGRLTGSRAFRDRVAHHVRSCLRGDPVAVSVLLEHPLCRRPRAGEPLLLLVVTSSRGLCGGYNTRVLQLARRRIRELEAAGTAVVLVVIGRRGASSFRYAGRAIAEAFTDIDEATPYARWNEIMSGLFARFERREIGGLEVASMRYLTKAVQEARLTTLLPLDPTSKNVSGPPVSGEPLYHVEPTQEAFLREAASLMSKAELTCLLVEALLSEQMQRTLAMRNATDSAETMVGKLTRSYNRARQAQVTAEMMEIVAGSQGVAGE